jgi:hypothetical protein
MGVLEFASSSPRAVSRDERAELVLLFRFQYEKEALHIEKTPWSLLLGGELPVAPVRFWPSAFVLRAGQAVHN